jgi:hypothetical protein
MHFKETASQRGGSPLHRAISRAVKAVESAVNRPASPDVYDEALSRITSQAARLRRFPDWERSEARRS